MLLVLGKLTRVDTKRLDAILLTPKVAGAKMGPNFSSYLGKAPLEVSLLLITTSYGGKKPSQWSGICLMASHYLTFCLKMAEMDE